LAGKRGDSFGDLFGLVEDTGKKQGGSSGLGKQKTRESCLYVGPNERGGGGFQSQTSKKKGCRRKKRWITDQCRIRRKEIG
jgi:hypothetical protein